MDCPAMQLQLCQQRCTTLFLEKADLELQNRQATALLKEVRTTCAGLPSHLAAAINRLLSGETDVIPERTISAPAALESPQPPSWLGSLGKNFDATLAEWDSQDSQDGASSQDGAGSESSNGQQPASVALPSDMELEFLAMGFTYDSAARRALLGTAFSQWVAHLREFRLGRMEAELMAKHRETMRMDAEMQAMSTTLASAKAAQIARCRAARFEKEQDMSMRSEIAMAAAFAVWVSYRDTCAAQRLVGVWVSA